MWHFILIALVNHLLTVNCCIQYDVIWCTSRCNLDTLSVMNLGSWGVLGVYYQTLLLSGEQIGGTWEDIIYWPDRELESSWISLRLSFPLALLQQGVGVLQSPACPVATMPNRLLCHNLASTQLTTSWECHFLPILTSTPTEEILVSAESW